MARGNSRASSEYSKADRGPNRAYNPGNFRRTVEANAAQAAINEASSSDNFPIKGPRDKPMPLKEAEKIDYTIGFGANARRAREAAYENAKKNIPTMDSRGVGFRLGPFEQRESHGYVKGKSTYKTISGGKTMVFELTAEVEWHGPLDPDDEQRITSNPPKYFIKRIA